MSDERFNVVFRGDIVPGQTLPDVKVRFAQVFRLEADKVDAYFSGKPMVLKKECDRATAEKFKAVLQQAGALVDIKNADAAAAAPRPAPVRPAPVAAPVVTPVVTPVPVAAAPAPAPQAQETPKSPPQQPQPSGEESWSLSARGADLLKPEERVEPEPVKVNIDYIQVAKRNPFATDMEEPLEASRDVAPPPLDLSAYQLSQTGGSLVEYQEFVPREIDLSELTLDAVGAMMVSEDDLLPMAAVEVDISGLDMAPAGGDLGQIKAPPPPPPPSTEHLSVDK